MRTTIFTAVVVGILGISTAVGAQQRYRPPTGSSRSSANAATSGSRTSPLLRGPVAGSRNAAATTRTSARRATAPGAGARRPMGITAPMMPQREQRFMAASVTRLLRGTHGSVSAPPGATRDSMRTLLQSAWSKMMYGGRDVKTLEVTNSRGTTRTFWVNMNRPTGQVTYPPNARGGANARGIPQNFRHVVIQYRTTPRGVETMRLFEPGRAAPPEAQTVGRRLY